MTFNVDFFTELQEKFPSAILDYWGMRNIYHFAQNMSFEHYIVKAICSSFEDVQQSQLSDHIAKIRTAQRKKKRDWHKKFLQYIEYPYNDSYNPLYNEYEKIRNMNSKEFIKDYEDMTIEEILDQKKERLTIAVDDWLEKKDSCFVEFPAFSIHNDRTRQNILKDDIIMAACNYIQKDLKFDFMQNVKSLPTPIVNKPIFSIAGSKIDLEEIDGVLQSIIAYGTEGDTFSVVPVHTDKKLTSLTKRDREVYHEITHIAITNGKDDADGYRAVPINYYSIATQLHGYAVNSKDIEVIKNSVAKLANLRYIYKKGNEQIDYVLIDSIVTNDDNPNEALLYLGRVPSQAIRNKDIISISKKMEDRIESTYGSFFIYALQGLRFMLYRDSPTRMSADLTMEFFEECLYFNVKSYKKKVSIVLECLDDYIKHEIIISNYYYSENIFHLEFLPFNDDDLKYYNDWVNSHPQKMYNEIGETKPRK